MNRPYLFIFSALMGIMMLVPSKAIAQNDSDVSLSSAEADSLYIQGDYLTAISIYEGILENAGVSASVYMNLGNAYFKIDEIAKAILCYERAYLLDPSDDDIRFNLELARTRTVDKVSLRNRLFIGVFFENMANLMNVNQWAVMTVVLFIMAIALACLFVLTRKLLMKKISFYAGIILFVFSVFSFVFASGQKGKLENRNTAVIMEPSVTVKSTPSKSGTDLFIIHEGHKVNVLDKSMKEWVQIELEDGNSGWIQFKSIEII